MIAKSLLKVLGTAAAVALLAGISTTAARASYTFDGHGFINGYSYDAEAIFENVGGNLQVTLTNTSQQDVLLPNEVLTALFFDVPGNVALTPESAVLGPTSTVYHVATQPSGGVVGGEWEYARNTTGAVTPSGGNVAKQGISSAGLGLLGTQTLFPGTNLDGPTEVDGLQYGITSLGDNPDTGNTPVTTGGDPLIHYQVVFLLSGLPADFVPSADTIQNVWFQYGTALTEGGGGRDITPEPAFYQMAGFLGLGGLGLLKLRRRRKA